MHSTPSTCNENVVYGVLYIRFYSCNFFFLFVFELCLHCHPAHIEEDRHLLQVVHLAVQLFVYVLVLLTYLSFRALRCTKFPVECFPMPHEHYGDAESLNVTLRPLGPFTAVFFAHPIAQVFRSLKSQGFYRTSLYFNHYCHILYVLVLCILMFVIMIYNVREYNE